MDWIVRPIGRDMYEILEPNPDRSVCDDHYLLVCTLDCARAAEEIVTAVNERRARMAKGT